jgi:hypothetical protein
MTRLGRQAETGSRYGRPAAIAHGRELPPPPTPHNKKRKSLRTAVSIDRSLRLKKMKGKGYANGSSGKYRVSSGPKMVAFA